MTQNRRLGGGGVNRDTLGQPCRTKNKGVSIRKNVWGWEGGKINKGNLSSFKKFVVVTYSKICDFVEPGGSLNVMELLHKDYTDGTAKLIAKTMGDSGFRDIQIKGLTKDLVEAFGIARLVNKSDHTRQITGRKS